MRRLEREEDLLHLRKPTCLETKRLTVILTTNSIIITYVTLKNKVHLYAYKAARLKSLKHVNLI